MRSRARAPRAGGRPARAHAVSKILLLVIAVIGPWAVHLAPPRQRPLALVSLLGILLLYGIFAHNPLTTWQLWVGLLAGVLTVAAVAVLGGGRKRPTGGGGRRRPRPPRASDPSSEQTGEL